MGTAAADFPKCRHENVAQRRMGTYVAGCARIRWRTAAADVRVSAVLGATVALALRSAASGSVRWGTIVADCFMCRCQTAQGVPENVATETSLWV